MDSEKNVISKSVRVCFLHQKSARVCFFFLRNRHLGLGARGKIKNPNPRCLFRFRFREQIGPVESTLKKNTTSKYNSSAYKYYCKYYYYIRFSIMGNTQRLPQTLLESFDVQTGEFDPQLYYMTTLSFNY